jgi:MFS family permease
LRLSRIFWAFWVAGLASNLGTWMQMVGSAWLMTSLTASAALVALLQTATSVPAFLLSLPAGALADVVDRPWLIIVTQFWQLLAAATLGILTIADVTTPTVLLLATFVLATGSTLGLPVMGAMPRGARRPREYALVCGYARWLGRMLMLSGSSGTPDTDASL